MWPCCLCRFGDHYEWNKVTSCIHNILSGQRWIEHYGEMAIKNINSDACQCRITFVKVRTEWSFSTIQHNVSLWILFLCEKPSALSLIPSHCEFNV